MKKILIINGSLGGDLGKTHVMISECQQILKQYSVQSEVLHLNLFFNTNIDHKLLLHEAMDKADGFLFTTGTYWDSWGSPLQKFLETITDFEATPVLFAKPCAVVVTMHSVGGKEVLSRLQGVLNTMGLLIPPMSGLVYALATHIAFKSAEDFAADFWSKDDLQVIMHNLISAADKQMNFKTWPVDKKDPARVWNK